MSPLLASFLFSVGVAILIVWFAPGPLADAFALPARTRSLKEKIRYNLRLAGMFDQTPTFYLIALAAISLSVAAVLGSLFSSVVAALPAPLIVLAVAHFVIMSRQRSYINRAANELTPFFNRMSTSLSAGRPAQQAYIDAVDDSKVLREVLEDSAAKLTTGMEFVPALLETIDLLPLRMWAIFVRQLELHDRRGGDVAKAINVTLTQLNEMMQLQAEARADYAAQARQQKLIIFIPFGGLAVFAVAVPNGAKTLSVLVTTTAGLFFLIVGISIMFFGLWFGRKQLRDIEEKLSF